MRLGIGFAPESGEMKARLRADLHVHTREGEAQITYDAREIIARAAREGYGVLAITNHDTITFSDELAAYAKDHDILLIPGVEATVEGRHVLVYNADVDADKLRTFADLRRYRTPDWLIAAPHPFFRRPTVFGSGYGRRSTCSTQSSSATSTRRAWTSIARRSSSPARWDCRSWEPPTAISTSSSGRRSR